MNVAILGAGNIAVKMAATLRGMHARGQDVVPYAIASRDLAKAQAFAQQHGIARAYGSYEAMLSDPAVDLVYIATPHSLHYEQMKACIAHRKPVLCEKAFTACAWQAEEVLAEAARHGLLVQEAMWTRFLPMMAEMHALLESGRLGKPLELRACVSGAARHIERIIRPELAGGALLDIGIYPLTLASMLLGDDVSAWEYATHITETGVDIHDWITLEYQNGTKAVIEADCDGNATPCFTILCENGRIELDSCYNPLTAAIYQNGSDVPEYLHAPEQINGYEYEVEACMHALQHGAIECPQMSHAQTLHMMRIMDRLRAEWNVVYPWDRAE